MGWVSGIKQLKVFNVVPPGTEPVLWYKRKLILSLIL